MKQYMKLFVYASCIGLFSDGIVEILNGKNLFGIKDIIVALLTAGLCFAHPKYKEDE